VRLNFDFIQSYQLKNEMKLKLDLRSSYFRR
jgi:hypothetical protein